MTVTDFILSDKRSHRITRHLTFWVSFAILYYCQSLVPWDNLFYVALISILCYFPAVTISVYGFLFLLLPKLKQKKYGLFFLRLILLCLFVVLWNHFASILFYYFTTGPLSSVKFFLEASQGWINSGHALSTGALILGFRVAKDWFRKNLETRQLEKLKIANDLQFEKSRLYPAFLLQSLRSMNDRMRSGAADSSLMILRLSDLLSYLLYDADDELIPLGKELSMINNFLEIESLNQSSHLSIQTDVIVIPEKRMIRPLVLFPLLQNFFEHIAKKPHDQFHVNIRITCEENHLNLNMLVRHSESLEQLPVLDGLMESIGDRLERLYQNAYGLLIQPKGGTMQLNMKVALANQNEMNSP